MNVSRLRRIIIILLMLAIPLTLGLFFYLNEQQFPTDAQDQLAQYLADTTIHSSEPTLQATLRALQPENFTQGLSQYSWGNHYYFNTTDQALGGKPLLYPPKTIWCLQLTYADAPSRVILLALHEDLYNAEWIIHDIATSSKTLTLIGCDSLLTH